MEPRDRRKRQREQNGETIKAHTETGNKGATLTIVFPLQSKVGTPSDEGEELEAV